MTVLDVLLVLAAGMAAGTINTIVGAGSLITFPSLLALGYPPIVANVTNTVGLVPGGFSGVVGYRRELAGQRARLVRYGMVAAAGGLTGGALLLVLPARVFDLVVPLLILMACLLVAIQPRLSRALAARRPGHGEGRLAVGVAVFATSIYGGYFGAAQGVILFGLLGVLIDDDLQRLNGLKNALVVVVNLVAACLFALVAPVAWPAAALLAIGSIAGGQIGAHLGRRLSPTVLRFAVIAVGIVVVVRLLPWG
jgi:uncharacterized membrane protein YfcA